jgi:very-short-patch-repair endonuclease
MDLGLSAAEARADVNTGKWQRIFPGVYATFTGPMNSLGRVWAAALYAGNGAAASHATALWLSNLVDEPPNIIDVSIPESRKVLPQIGIRVHRRRGLDSPDRRLIVHPAARPPRLRVEEAVLETCGTGTAANAIDLILRSTQRRITTAERLRRRMTERPRQPWRALLGEVLADIDDGVASPLERRYRGDVERRHHLPQGACNEAEVQRFGGRWYRDVRYRAWHVIVELDGREAHPVDEAFRDMRRDNVAALAGDTSLRFGWRDVVSDPCGVATQVVAVLRLGGWAGLPRACNATCTVERVS